MARKEIPQNPVIRRVLPGTFDIEGRAGDLYTVRFGECSCKAAQNGRACWHLEACRAWAKAHPAPRTTEQLAKLGGQHAPVPLEAPKRDFLGRRVAA